MAIYFSEPLVLRILFKMLLFPFKVITLPMAGGNPP